VSATNLPDASGASQGGQIVYNQSFVGQERPQNKDLFTGAFWEYQHADHIFSYAITAFEKSHIRATAPGLRAGITTVSPRAHFRMGGLCVAFQEAC
jgi:hypothetical protein